MPLGGVHTSGLHVVPGLAPAAVTRAALTLSCAGLLAAALLLCRAPSSEACGLQELWHVGSGAQAQ